MLLNELSVEANFVFVVIFLFEDGGAVGCEMLSQLWLILEGVKLRNKLFWGLED